MTMHNWCRLPTSIPRSRHQRGTTSRRPQCLPGNREDTTWQRRPPPLRSQQRALKPSIFPSDSDSQHSFTYLCEFPESSTLISLIFVAKSEFSRVLAKKEWKSHSNGNPPLQSPQPPPKSSIFPSNSDSPYSITLFWKFPERYT
jgi:hypothetical protein